MFTFASLAQDHLPLIHKWLNTDHVANFYDGYLSRDQVEEKYLPKIESEIVFPYIVSLEDRPIGYIQTYNAPLVGDGWWQDQPDGTWGIDQFLGEKSLLGKGIGSAFVNQFSNELLKRNDINRVITDPAPHNPRAIRAYEKAGFQIIEEIQTPDGTAILMEKTKTS